MQSRQVAVDDTGAELVTADRGPKNVLVVIPGALSTEAYIGGSGVTASNGMHLPPDGVIYGPIPVRQNDSLHAICQSTESTTVHVLEA